LANRWAGGQKNGPNIWRIHPLEGNPNAATISSNIVRRSSGTDGSFNMLENEENLQFYDQHYNSSEFLYAPIHLARSLQLYDREESKFS
jgi:hypothetical protein